MKIPPRIPSIFLSGQDFIQISQAQIEELKGMALQAEFKRARICLHPNHQDPIQEMIIAFCKGTYFRPHRHQNKSESFHMIEGKLAIIFFDDQGAVTRRVVLEAGKSTSPFIYRLNQSLWHTIVILSEFALVHEITNGPFVWEEREFAPWSLVETDVEGIEKFLAKITKNALS
jgi:cupin fold WbuC family metalloprotein